MNIITSYSKPLHLNRIEGKEMRSIYMWKDCEYLVFPRKHLISLNKRYLILVTLLKDYDF